MRSVDIRERLRQSGLRCTPAREAVLRLLCGAHGGLAHGQVAEGRRTAGLDRVTLYRTLGALVAAGLVHRVQGVDGIWYYHAHPATTERCPAGHPHFQCVRCGRVRCLADQSLPWIAVAPGERVLGKQLIVHGLCRSCAVKDAGDCLDATASG